jgi:nicotinate-nucleotide adenylyltransferase
MVRAAVAGKSLFEVSDVEGTIEGSSYTYDVARMIAKQNFDNDEMDTDPAWLIGSDNIPLLNKWHKIDELLKMVRFIAVERPGHSYQAIEGVSVITSGIPLLEIGSTEIRRRMLQGQSISWLVPHQVERAITDYDFYQPLRNAL